MIKEGKENKIEHIVLPDMTAAAMRSGDADVLSTPILSAWMEEAAWTMVAEDLESNQTTVGMRMELDHIAATPVGMHVTCTAVLAKVKGRVLTFTIEAYDDKEQIGKATHLRCIVDREKFNHKAQIKMTESGNPAKPQGKAGEEMLERMNRSHYEMTGWALDHMEWNPKDKVLDIGCGGGMTLKRLKEAMPDAALYGIDYSKTSVDTARALNADHPDIQIEQASVEKLPFENDTFDKIVTVESFYFWPDPAQNLHEAVRVLKPSGTLMIAAEIYGDASLSEEEKANVEKYHLFNPTKEEYKKIFHDAGLSCRIDTYHNWICVTGTKAED
ncbi:thioesterase, FlK family [Catenisphaera adipataccumulans]|uniref:Putative thioesterase/ubiquinone/menaquinone biosynthesis C-methylase UbiE n=1 Tax=Catenisphaera adipataccumulans TaxID=700500 RepID=A0A7W8CXL4_9FIRM|nr:methyltransferase domain-containing protein [Catenisphaera adipataccumulans]MBB5182284.1 putative thioesterase/ubiquinone/menaquinone biosynthesis C-methylase UbiE [Catenisphaera adipataccumulans]